MNYLKVFVLVNSLLFGFNDSPSLADFIGHGGMIRDIDLSADGSRVLTASFDYSAILWDFVDQKKIKNLNAHNGPVTSVTFVKNNRALTASDDMSVIFWNLDTRKPIYRFMKHTHKVMSTAVSGNNRYAATGGWDALVYVWDLHTGKSFTQIKLKSPVNAVVFLGSTKNIAIGTHDGIIYIFDISSRAFKGKLVGHQMGITDLSSSSDGKQLLSASIDGSVRLWDIEKLIEIKKLKGHSKQVYSVKFLEGDKTAASAGRDGLVIQWDLISGKVKRKIVAHRSAIWSIAASRDGRFVVSAGADESAKVWHVSTGDQINANFKTNNEPKPWLSSDHPGAKLFKKCARCHAVRASYVQRSGPHLENVFGRQIGSVVGYNYSKALKDSKIIWNKKSIAELFEQGPDKYLPGTKMPVQKIGNQNQLRDLVIYLKELTSGKQLER